MMFYLTVATGCLMMTNSFFTYQQQQLSRSPSVNGVSHTLPFFHHKSVYTYKLFLLLFIHLAQAQF